jgi:predicted transcriptional regulator
LERKMIFLSIKAREKGRKKKYWQIKHGWKCSLDSSRLVTSVFPGKERHSIWEVKKNRTRKRELYREKVI